MSSRDSVCTPRVRIAANDRDGLEHLARYLARPPIATDRISQLADGRIMLRFKRPFSDGTAAVVFTPFELIERLLPLVPRPRKHTIRFHGILAPAAGFRSKVVPTPLATPISKEPGVRQPSPYRLPWAELLKRVFIVDALECRRCHGRMRIVSAVIEPGAVRRILHLVPPRGVHAQSAWQQGCNASGPTDPVSLATGDQRAGCTS